MYTRRHLSLTQNALHREIQARSGAGLLRAALPGDLLSATPATHHGTGGDGRAHATPRATPTDGTEAIATWVALLDRADAAIHAGNQDDPYLQRSASRLIDSVYLYEHQMTGEARRLAREYVWLRDRDEPLPPPAERQVWEQCLCHGCFVERVLHRPSVVALLRPLPTVPMSRMARTQRAAARATQATLPLPA